jgi:hypothetical protein
MAYSFNYKHTADFEREESKRSSDANLQRPVISKTKIGVLASAVFLGLLLFCSWSLDSLFMRELIAVTCVWGLVSMVKLQSEPKNTSHEKR